MVNPTGTNGVDNGTWPSDEELSDSLKSYAYKCLSTEMRLLYLERDHGLKIKREKLRQLNKKFDIPSMRKPPSYGVAKAYVCEKVAQDVSQRNGPRQIQRDLKMDKVLIPRDTIRKIVREEASDSAEFRDPAKCKKRKIRGALTGLGVLQQVHRDGHEKLGPLALKLGGVGILIDGYRDHSSGKILWLQVVPNDRNECIIGHTYLDFVEANGFVIPIQMTVDGGNETGIMYASHRALCNAYLDLDESKFPTWVALKSTDNISIESVWSYWLKARGHTLRQVILSGAEKGYFIVGNKLHADLFQWLWPQIVQVHLDEFKDMFNGNATRFQREKKLPSGVSPDVVFDFPARYGLEYLGCPVDREAVDTLRKGIPVTKEEAFRWVPDEFNILATQAYEEIGCTKLVYDNGWDIFNKMVHILDSHVLYP